MLRLLFVEDDIAVTQSKMSGQVWELSILDLNLNGENRAELSPGVLIYTTTFGPRPNPSVTVPLTLLQCH